MRGRVSTHKDFLLQLKQEGDCLVWAGAKVWNGYGQFKIKQVSWRTHRYSYTYYVGEIPEGLLVLHSCDNRPCVLPSHLRLGTHADNIKDTVDRGRWKGSTPRPTCNKGHKRTTENTYTNPQSKRFCRVCRKENRINK